MRAHLPLVLALQAYSAVAAPAPQATDAATSDAVSQLADFAQLAFDQAQADATNSSSVARRSGSTCNWSNVKIRREWGALSSTEKKAYIAAVKCLQSKPAKTPASLAPGAKTRFDDFVSTHINQTLTIHYTGNFLVWHRYYTWLYEQALQQECGYTGTQPYWDWAKTAITGMETSPIFDGSATSMSGNGAVVANQGDIVLGLGDLPPLTLPSGTGGGCVTSGPFKDMSVNLGPVSLSTPGGGTETSANPFAYNPRCLKRDLTTAINRQFANASAILSNIRDPKTINDFQMQMQGVPGTGSIGIHGGGHYALGGDPGRDVFTSPGDPAFYLHHGQIDRVWWIWQMLGKGTERIYGSQAIFGTNTFLDSPPSANTTLDDYVSYDFASGPPRQIRDLMSTLDGPFCYVYA